MFHVSTELPFDAADAQCLERKRHLGNDVVVIVYLEGDGQFDPSSGKLFMLAFYHVLCWVVLSFLQSFCFRP